MTTSITPLAAFLGGALTLLAPCSVMLLPAFFAYAFTSRTTLLARTGLFWLGLVTTLVPLGAAAGGMGAVLRDHEVGLTMLVAVVVVVLGVAQALEVEVPRPRLPTRARRAVRGGGAASVGPVGRVDGVWPVGRTGVAGRDVRDSASPLSVYLLGAVYGLAGVGCAGPILGAVLAMAAMGGSPLQAAGLMVLYGTGMALPLGLAALVWDAVGLSSGRWLRPRTVRVLGRRTTWTSLVSGTLFVVLGVALVLTGPSNPVGGLVDGDTMARVEVGILAAARRVPWWTVAGVVAALGGAVVVARREPR